MKKQGNFGKQNKKGRRGGTRGFPTKPGSSKGHLKLTDHLKISPKHPGKGRG